MTVCPIPLPNLVNHVTPQCNTSITGKSKPTADADSLVNWRQQ